MTQLTGWPEPVTAGYSSSDSAVIDSEVVELMLLLPRYQAAALEAAARARGMTTGQILRRVIADLFPAGECVGR